MAHDLGNLSGPELEEQLRRRIEARMNARNGLFIHLIAFIGANLLLWVIWLMTGMPHVVWPLFATIPWAMALAIHAYVVYQGSGSALERRQQNIRREMELEKVRLGLAEKPKRDQAMCLSDDGEIVSDDEADMKPKRDTISAN